MSAGPRQDLSGYQVRRRAHQILTCPGFDLLHLWKRARNITCIWFTLTNQTQLQLGGTELTKIQTLIIFMDGRSLQVLNIHLCVLALRY